MSAVFRWNNAPMDARTTCGSKRPHRAGSTPRNAGQIPIARAARCPNCPRRKSGRTQRSFPAAKGLRIFQTRARQSSCPSWIRGAARAPPLPRRMPRAAHFSRSLFTPSLFRPAGCKKQARRHFGPRFQQVHGRENSQRITIRKFLAIGFQLRHAFPSIHSSIIPFS